MEYFPEQQVLHNNDTQYWADYSMDWISFLNEGAFLKGCVNEKDFVNGCVKDYSFYIFIN